MSFCTTGTVTALQKPHCSSGTLSQLGLAVVMPQSLKLFLLIQESKLIHILEKLCPDALSCFQSNVPLI